jgi:16S rRNA (cytidine1402-2'-O)-methyltransferase
MPNLYLIPTTLGDSSIEKVLPAEIMEVVRSLKYFVVENTRTARRHLKKMVPEIIIAD